jgi:hypothetical protein
MNLLDYFFRPFRREDNRFLALMIEEIGKDLEHAASLASIPEDERTETERFLFNMLRQRYSEEDSSKRFASRRLMEEYDGVYQEIRRVLYN